MVSHGPNRHTAANVADVKRLRLFVRDRCGTGGHDGIERRADRKGTREFFAALPGMWIAVRKETASARASSHHKRSVPQSQNHR